MLFLVVLQVFVVTISGCFANKLPSHIPRCRINDPEIGVCISKITNLLRPCLREGIKELGIPSFEPRIIPNVEVSQESNLVNYTIDVRNYTIRGLNNYDITNIQYDPETLTFKGKFQLDPLSIQGLYSITGKVLAVPIKGNGLALLAIGPANGTFEITGDMMKLNDLDHYKPKDVKIRLIFDDMSIYFNGLFDGYEELADMTNDFLNRNSKTIADAITPTFEIGAEKLIMRYFKWLTKRYPYQELFPRS